jgi:protein TonB
LSHPASLPADEIEDERGALRRRIAGVTATILAELVIIALLLTLGWNLSTGKPDPVPVTTFEARDVSDAPPAPEEADTVKPSPQTPSEAQPPQPEIVETPDIALPTPLDPPPLTLPSAPPPPPPPRPAPRPPKPATPPGPVYGPPDTGAPAYSADSERVGTAPNGEPMYAARWYREPTRQQLAGYLSTATAPASALIVCRTVPDFYVEDCELLGESPAGSQIGRAVLAAAWQFRVRPAIVGGRSQVGSWVRIRIDYRRTVER